MVAESWLIVPEPRTKCAVTGIMGSAIFDVIKDQELTNPRWRIRTKRTPDDGILFEENSLWLHLNGLELLRQQRELMDRTSMEDEIEGQNCLTRAV